MQSKSSDLAARTFSDITGEAPRYANTTVTGTAPSNGWSLRHSADVMLLRAHR